jgi:peptidoglycan/xylan/chitin deacetylase (PgdA/CDA1 family)
MAITVIRPQPKTKTLRLLLLAALLVGCESPAPSGMAMVSFNYDDGFVSGYNSLPIFDNAGIKVTEFIITGRMAGERGPQYVTAAQVLDAERRGHEIAAHTRTHPELPTLTKDEQITEIQGSKEDLEKLLGHPVENFAYPYGEHNHDSVADVQAAGFASARIVRADLNSYQTNPYTLYAYVLQRDTTIDDIKGWVDQAKANQEWLILLIHRVDEDPSISVYTVQSRVLQQTVAYIREQKIQTVTMSEGIHLYYGR